ncbi:MAG: response regulator [Deltaproteobacteria bacterium]|nr:response regulator [Deltaproteobacteria bacterium]
MTVPRKIGIVDDAVTMRTAFGLTFAGEDLGLEPRSFATADAAIKSGESLDLLYVDTKLGAEDGYAACAKLRGQPAFSGTPIVLLFGPWETFDEARARSCGAVGGIQKPWDAEDMIQKAQAFLSAAPPPVMAGAAAAAPAPAPAPAAPAARPAAVPAPIARPVPPGAPVPPASAQRVPTQIQLPGRPGPFPGAVPARSVPGAPTATHAPVGPRPAAGLAAAPVPARPAQAPAASPMPLREFAQAAAPAATKAVEQKVAAEVPGLTSEQMAAVVKLISREVIEQVAWEVVPDLAEAIIREQIQALLKE